MLKKAALLAGLLTLTSLAAFAQDGRFVVSLNASGLLPQQSRNGTLVLNPTNSAGFLGTVQWKFAPHSSFALNYGRAVNSEKYTQSTIVYRVKSDVTELSLAYTYTTQFGDRIHPFVFGGGGVLVFGPTDTLVNDVISTPLGAVRQSQPAVLYGGGVDYSLLGALALRLQYRGLFYQPPSYKVPFLSMTGHTHLAEPSIGLSFTF